VSTGPEHYGAAGYESADDPADGTIRRIFGAFSRWRNTRPFWGGLLVILSGGLILLSEQGPIGVLIHIGLQGLAGYLIPAILLLCGLLLLFNPVQRTFYALLAILLALGSWITSNFGGFFVGMLLGLIGGALAFAWEQRDGPARRTGAHRGGMRPPSWLRQRPEHSHGLSLVVGQPDDTEDAAGDDEDDVGSSRPASDVRRSRSDGSAGYGAVAVPSAALGLLFVLGPLPTHYGGSLRPVQHVSSPLGAAAAAARSGLTATSAVLTGLTFDGIARVPTEHGTVEMLEFTMTSLVLSGTRIRFAVAGVTVSASAMSLGLGGVVLLATKLSGLLGGKQVSYTPKHPPSSVPKMLTFSNMVTGQPYLAAATLQASGLGIAAPAGT
jgi:hypothetical protein